MNTAQSLRPTLASNHSVGSGSHTTDWVRAVASGRAFIFTVALAWLIGFSPPRAFAYGIYEEEIIDMLADRYGIIRPASTDAPELFSEAFLTPAPGDNDEGLASLEGYLDVDDGDFADLYCIFIGGAPPNLGEPYMRFTPEQFTVSFVAPQRLLDDMMTPRPMIGDPQLFLFDAMGHPVVGNDDIDDTNQQASIPLGTITQSGVYILAVTGSGYDPTDAAMNMLFTNNSTGLKTPTNATAVQAGWTGTHNQDGYYRLRFGVGVDGEPSRVIGVEHWVVPEPSTFPLLVLGLSSLALWRKCG